ncbi:hypothetical protein [Streptomyces sp. NPDC054786]
MRRRPRVAIGAAVRVFSTGSQFGFLVCLPFFFTETVGFSTSAWLRLLSVMFAALHLATAVAIRFLEPDPEFTAPDVPPAVDDAGLPAERH